MNLVQFLKKIDMAVSGMSKEQLKSYIHEIARTLPEERRQYFLETLEAVQNGRDVSTVKPGKHHKDIYSEIKEIMDVLAEINHGDRCLDSEYNEEWDDWYNSEADEVLFSDPEGLLQDIRTGIDLLHKCVDMELYREGCELAELLSVLEVSVEGDYNDYDGTPLGIHELYDHQLLEGTFRQVMGESLYLIYMGNESADRAEELYCMMGNYGCYEISLEEIMQRGSQDLPELKEFLSSWIDYLGNQTGMGAKKLLLEGQAMVGDTDRMLESAKKFVHHHPELYQQLLEKIRESEDWEQMLSIGLEALDHIPVNNTIRSKIALLAAEAAGRMKDCDRTEACWMEAFRSQTTVVNYMRIRFLTRDWKRYRRETEQIYQEVYERSKQESKTGMGYYYGQQYNSLHHHTYCMLLFFDRKYEEVIRTGMNEKRALGWSLTFMKEGIALFLLLLYKGKTLSIGMDTMLRRVVSDCGFCADQFFEGTCSGDGKMEKEFFWELFDQWKEEADLPEEDCSRWMKMVEGYISMRTEGIMEANRRNYYGECAAWIAAYGEVCESRGTYGAKAEIMGAYKAKYSRRRAFHQELRSYGMKS